MNVNLHKNARTTPAIRDELRTSKLGERQLAEQYNLNRATVRKCASETPLRTVPTGPISSIRRFPRPRKRWS